MTRLAAAWLAFMIGLIAGGEIQDLSSFAIGAAAGLAAVWLGFAAASRCRPPLHSTTATLVKDGVIAVAAGVALGLANLWANWLIASAYPTLRALLIERFRTLSPITGLVASPLVEEVLVRLFLMSAIAWAVSRVTQRPSVIFVAALVASAVVFAALHLDRAFPGDPAAASFYRAALMVKYTLGGLPMGWLFWRRGLPFAIACHVAANGTHLLLQGVVFAMPPR